MTRASARGDDDAAVAILVIKGVNKAVPFAPDYKDFLFGDKGTGRRYAPRPTSPWGTPTFPCGPSWPSCMDGGYSATGISFTPMDRVHGQPGCGAPCSTFCAT